MTLHKLIICFFNFCICILLVHQTETRRLVYFVDEPINCTLSPCVGYLHRREQLVTAEREFSFDSDLILTPEEIKVNTIIKALRDNEQTKFNGIISPAVNFRQMRQTIDSQSQLFQIIRKMPKGAILHTHGLVDAWFLIKNGTYRLNCYRNNYTGSFVFSNTSPGPEWQNVPQMRQKSKDPAMFDFDLWLSTQFFTPNYSVSEDEMWQSFEASIDRINSIYSYKPVFLDATLDLLQKIADDNIQHVEMRGIHRLYDLVPPFTYNSTAIIKQWLAILHQFNANSATKLSVRWINTARRNCSQECVWQTLVNTVMMRNDPEVRKYIIGFDLVGEEDRYHSLAYYLDDFFRIQQYTQSNGYPNLPFYFHAGETFWNRKSHDNLYEAILLNTSRIGHGLALQYHPVLMQIVRSRKIAIEVCPISNQLLRFVSDLRNHPAVVYMTNGLPVAISNDDPHVFGYSGLSYDYYEAIISWNLTLRNIKQLAMNSLLFSGLEGNEKSQQLRDWTTRWKSWIEWVLSQFSTESFDNKAKLN